MGKHNETHTPTNTDIQKQTRQQRNMHTQKQTHTDT